MPSSDPPAAPQTDYAAQSKAQIDEQNNQAQIDQQKTDSANALAAQQAAQTKADALATQQQAQGSAAGKLSQKYNAALGYGTNEEGTLFGSSTPGNDYGLMNHYTDLLNQAKDNVDIDDITDKSDISAALAPIDSTSIFNTAQNDILGQQRSKLTSDLNNQFGDNYANTAIGDNYLDSYGQQLIGAQRTAAETTLKGDQARGLLNDQGYQAAESALNTQGTAASGTLKNLESGIIGNYRQGLTDAVNAGQKSASGWNFGDTYDPSQTAGSIKSLLGTDASSSQGDLASALGTTNLFDVGTALAGGTTAMGTTNGTGGTSGTGTGTSLDGAGGNDALTSAFASAVANNAATKRLLGNQGIA